MFLPTQYQQAISGTQLVMGLPSGLGPPVWLSGWGLLSGLGFLPSGLGSLLFGPDMPSGL